MSWELLLDSILIDMDFKRPTKQHHEEVFVPFDPITYRYIMQRRWDVWKNEPIKNAEDLCYCLRKAVNTYASRQLAVLKIIEKNPRIIVFYNFDYELEILRSLAWPRGTTVAEWSEHWHEPVPDGKAWVYLVNYSAGAEGWDCTKTDTIVFYSQNYSYKVMMQASGRIDRLNTPYHDLYYYHLKSRSGIDLAISRALKEKRTFKENRFVKW